MAATCKTSALKDAGHDYRPSKDNYYDSIQEQIDTEAEVRWNLMQKLPLGEKIKMQGTKEKERYVNCIKMA